jgi:2-(1,2-epoxy-1,2-dihydrophenyl)acetyl-CoA isomerase
MEIAKGIAAAPPLALTRIKENLNDADDLNFPAALDREAERHGRSAFHPDAAEAGMSFMEKRAPAFTGVAGTRKPWMYSKI